MPVIAKIEVQKKNKNRYNIYFLEDEQLVFAFGVSQDTLVRLNLHKGQELTELDIIEIEFDDHVSKAFQLSVRFISFRPRSEKEIITYLQQQDYKQTVIDEVLHRLRAYNYLNNLHFAKAFVRNEMKISRKGRKRIQMELAERGISEVDQLEALREYSHELEYNNAYKWVEKQFAKQKTSSKETLTKVRQLLLRKGFSSDCINIVLQQFSVVDEEKEWELLCLHGYRLHRKYANYDDFEYLQKMKLALLRKGFSADLVSRFLTNGKDQIESQEIE